MATEQPDPFARMDFNRRYDCLTLVYDPDSDPDGDCAGDYKCTDGLGNLRHRGRFRVTHPSLPGAPPAAIRYAFYTAPDVSLRVSPEAEAEGDQTPAAS